VLSSSQLETLAACGEERTAQAGETLFAIGDADYPFIAIIEGQAAVRDEAGEEIVRHGSSGFVGEINLLSGQTVFLTAVALEPMRYIAVDREALRGLLFEDGSLSDLLLTAFVERRELLQQRQWLRGRRWCGSCMSEWRRVTACKPVREGDGRAVISPSCATF
jgi:thioredoxin reductase (NADPH)